MAKHFQQSTFWAQFKCAHGWTHITHNNVSVLVRTFRLGFLHVSLAYIPFAPVPDTRIPTPKAGKDIAYIKQLDYFTEELKFLLPKRTLCVRYDLPLDFATVAERDAYNSSVSDMAVVAHVNIKKSRVDIQPPDSVLLDLVQSTEGILANMKSKWRYNVRYAQKHGVIVRAIKADSPDFEKDLDSFYALYKTTASRDGIGIHPLSYYKDLLERGVGSAGETEITLYIASHEGEDLAAIITLFGGEEAVYLYGCSSNNKRNLMPNYLVQWTAIQDAKQFGCKVYDFYGIPPTDAPNHPMHGLYLFKTGWGGSDIHRPGSFDIPLSPLYALYILAEKVRAFWFKRVQKKLRGR
ncbi:MAG: peptidoglycan bridge formation glycyltransferase FemA/FemB family protein [Treponema sp.]|nr:peptidoglycan bridge formation glycyltransferase FemA/FemB family protein [Treponema sp.]